MFMSMKKKRQLSIEKQNMEKFHHFTNKEWLKVFGNQPYTAFSLNKHKTMFKISVFGKYKDIL